MDWDWEDGPPRATPPARRPPDESGPPDEPEPPEPTPPGPTPPEASDESVTQVFSADAAWEQRGERPSPEAAPHSPPPEYVLPERTDTGLPAAQEDAGFADLSPAAADAAYERRPGSAQERAARREQRRRQIRRRRLVALAILVAIVVLIVVLVIRGCGGSDAAAAAVLGMIALDGRFVTPPGRR